MALVRLTRALEFPPPESATRDGIVALGGDLSVERLLLAYQFGIFPWPIENFGLCWFCPNPRYAIVPAKAHLPRSLRKLMRRGTYEVRADTAFEDVIAGCASTRRPGQRGTWITPGIRAAYRELHEEGFAHSVEAYRDGNLAGGLYGVSLGAAFYGESMFALEPDASKVAFGTLLGNLVRWAFTLVDCQVYTEHLARFGARPWPRRTFLSELKRALERPTRKGPWKLDLDPAAAEEVLRGREVS